MGEGKPILICVRVDGCPTAPVPSVERDCESCKKPCWVSTGSLPIAEEGRVRCVECATAHVQGRWN